ncbi:uncharacterized protein LOC142176704 [Nicotiana tabacum]|uniref:Uncharacterized protein LOC142176704 n=1 Tax=Nicotiana tabacum TaxID=4097 RepID=A0AC58TUT4_TOBAC
MLSEVSVQTSTRFFGRVFYLSLRHPYGKQGNTESSAIRRPPGEQGKTVQVSREDSSSFNRKQLRRKKVQVQQSGALLENKGRQLKFQGKAVSKEDNSSSEGKQFRRKTIQVSRENGSRCKGKQCQVTREDGSSSAIRRPPEKKGIQFRMQFKLVTIKEKRERERQEVKPNT